MNDVSLDRDLRDLFAAGPRAASSVVVDRAISDARTVPQRRPRISALDRRAWPPKAGSVADPAVHRTLRVLAVAALVLLLAAVVAVGARLLDRPPSVTIVTAGTLDSVVYGPRLLLWPDGRILVQGENGDRRLFDPATGLSERLSLDPDWALANLAVLPDGRVVLTQGRRTDTGGQTSIDVAFFDRTTGTVQPVGSFDTPWFAESTLVLHDGRVLISGGVLFPIDNPTCSPLTCEVTPTPAPTATYATSEGAKDTVRIFDPDNGTTTEVGHLKVARFQHQMLELDDGRILVVGGGIYGTDATGNSEASQIEVFDLATGTAKTAGFLKPGFTQFLLSPARLDDGRVIVVEATVPQYPCGIPSFTPGQPVHPDDIRTTYRQPISLFDPVTDRMSDGPTIPHYLGGDLVPLPNGRVLAFGTYQVFPADCATKPGLVVNPWLGVADIGRNTVFETYNPMTGIASLDVSATRAYGAGVRLLDGRVALIADDPLHPEKNAIDIVTIGP